MHSACVVGAGRSPARRSSVCRASPQARRTIPWTADCSVWATRCVQMSGRVPLLARSDVILSKSGTRLSLCRPHARERLFAVSANQYYTTKGPDGPPISPLVRAGAIRNSDHGRFLRAAHAVQRRSWSVRHAVRRDHEGSERGQGVAALAALVCARLTVSGSSMASGAAIADFESSFWALEDTATMMRRYGDLIAKAPMSTSCWTRATIAFARRTARTTRGWRSRRGMALLHAMKTHSGRGAAEEVP